MDLNDLNDLDISNIGDWPAPIKFLIVLALWVAIGVGWYYFDTKDQNLELRKVQKIEIELKQDYEKKQAKAANLEAYKQQLAEMQDSFGAMLRQLPNKSEVAALLVDVSQTGLAAGLEFELFEPKAEVIRDFYVELPIKITVVGQFHQFGEFVSGLAALPRIVTIHNVQIARQDDSLPGGSLVMQAQANTYRYIDEDEIQDGAEAVVDKKSKKKKRRG